MPTNPTVTTAIIEETEYKLIVACTGSFVDVQETAALKLDADSLSNGGVYPGKTPTLNLKRAQWSCSGSGIVKVLFDATTPVLAVQLGGSIGDQVYDAAITNPMAAGYTGDILFTTTGFASGGSYQVILTFEKSLGSYTTAPFVTALTIEDAKSGTYKTGDTFSVQATFNQNINPDSGLAYIELNLGSPAVTVRAMLDRSNPPIGSPAHATGAGTAYAVFQYTFKSSDQAVAGGFTLGHITGINGTGIGQLNVIDSLPALANISNFVVNYVAAPTVALVAGTGPRYDSGETMSVTATYAEAITVTGHPTIPVVMTSGNKVLSYASGSGTAVLTFSYTPVLSGDISASGTVSITSPISLAGGTVKDTVGNNAPLTFTPPDLSSVSFNHI